MPLRTHRSAICLFALSLGLAALPGIVPANGSAPAGSAAASEIANPLLSRWTTPHEVPPFDQIRPEHFRPAFYEGMREHRSEIAAIAAQRSAPSFANTILALERAGLSLERTQAVFFNLTSSSSSPALRAIQREISPALAAHNDAITLDPALFARIKAVHDARASLRDPQQRRLVERYYTGFVRGGALLQGSQRERFAQINQRLATLTTQFSQNVLADTAQYALVLEGEDDLAGLPGFFREAAAEAARSRGLEGKHVVTLARSSVEPFLQLSSRRDLREQAFKAWAARGDNGDAEDNNAIAAEMVALRNERAQVLGFANHAAFTLDDTMAKTPASVDDLLRRVWQPAVSAVSRDAERYLTLARSQGFTGGQLEPWDWRYYAEQKRQAEFAINEEEVKPYFTLDRMLEAQFWVANRLFGLTFTEITGTVPVYHPDVRVWAVNEADGRPVGLFYGDFFARESKQGGAWMSSFRTQDRINGNTRPVVVNVLNYTKAPAGRQTLLSYDDAETLFHEFGHALHGLLSDVAYPSLAGTAVSRDFVEFPAQIFEHWLARPEVLSRFARHVDTGAGMPPELLAKVMAARNHDIGFATVEFLASAFVDMDVHSRTGTQAPDLAAFEDESLARIGMPREIIMRHRMPHFGHIFSGGYSAGYYSYMWSEVLDADGFRAFTETGDVFDRATAQRLRAYVYASGNSRDPAESYRMFRGRDPDAGALLTMRGFAQE
jgi:peptidyl-dipeptidase Dcp